MVVKSATKKRLLDLFSPDLYNRDAYLGSDPQDPSHEFEKYAHLLATDRKMDQVRDLSPQGIAVITGDESFADVIWSRILFDRILHRHFRRNRSRYGLDALVSVAGPRSSLSYRRADNAMFSVINRRPAIVGTHDYDVIMDDYRREVRIESPGFDLPLDQWWARVNAHNRDWYQNYYEGWVQRNSLRNDHYDGAVFHK